MNTKIRANQWKVTKGNPQPLGISRTQQGVNFAVEVKKGQLCELLLYKKNSSRIDTIIPLEETYQFGAIRAVLLEEFPYEQYEYKYRINGTEQLDPYALFVEGKRKFGVWKKQQAGKLRCGFWKKEFDWEDDQNPRIPLQDIILYSMHVRGFTKHYSSNVEARGSYQGIMEKIPYLKQLGINQVELMPTYEFVEQIPKERLEDGTYCQENEVFIVNYWGYGTENYYFAPKKTYSFSGEAGTELKQLVKELHKNGIEIILEFYFDKRTRMNTRLECLKYWVMEYHIDGFHITGDSSFMEELLKEPFLSDVKIYAANLDLSWLYRMQEKTDERRAAVYAVDYMTTMRGFLKGDAGRIRDITYYLRRNHNAAGFVNYFACHDGFTMMDMVSYDHKHNEANKEDNQDGWEYNCSWNCGVEGSTRRIKILELRKRQLKNAWVLLLLSQGIPSILAGDELCNSQKGNNNTYCQDNELGWINWNHAEYWDDMYEFVQRLIQLRQNHPILHMQQEARLMDDRGVGYPDISYHSEKAWFLDERRPGYCLGVLYCGDYVEFPGHTGDDYFYIAYNMHWNKQHFAVPDIPNNRKWQYLIDTGKTDSFFDGKPVRPEHRTMEVMPRTIVVLIGRKVPEKIKNGKKTKRTKRT